MNTLAAGPAAMTSYTLTTAGLAFGLALAVVEHLRWWRGGAKTPAPAPAGGKGTLPPAPTGKARDPWVVVPFWIGLVFGTLCAACTGGLLGNLAGFLRWGGNGLGGTVMNLLTGQDPADVANASAPALDSYGALIVTALVIVLWLLRKQFTKVIKGKFWRGTWCGALLAIGTGVFAYIGNLVVPGANDLGSLLIGKLVNGDLGSWV